MFISTEDQELSSRDSEFQTGLLLKRDTVGNLILTQDRFGKTHFKIFKQNQLQPNSLEREWNQTLLNGSDSNNGERVLVQDSSTTKFQSLSGLDTVEDSI